MDFIKENLPYGFTLRERILEDNKVSYDIFIDLGQYDEHDELFEKYDTEPSAYRWEELIKVLVPKSELNFIDRILFDCNADEFFAITSSELDQVKLANYFLSLSNNAEKLESTLKLLSQSRDFKK